MSTELLLSVGTIAAHFLLYTTYNKLHKTYDFNQLKSIVTFSNGWRYSFGEIHKVLGLSGMCLLSFSLLPYWDSALLRFYCSNIVMGHSFYAHVVMYGGSPWKTWFNNPRVLAVALGQASFGVLLWFEIGPKILYQIAIVLAYVHFYLMELKPGPYSGSVKLRPFGYVACTLPLIALAASFFL